MLNTGCLSCPTLGVERTTQGPQQPQRIYASIPFRQQSPMAWPWPGMRCWGQGVFVKKTQPCVWSGISELSHAFSFFFAAGQLNQRGLKAEW